MPISAVGMSSDLAMPAMPTTSIPPPQPAPTPAADAGAKAASAVQPAVDRAGGGSSARLSPSPVSPAAPSIAAARPEFSRPEDFAGAKADALTARARVKTVKEKKGAEENGENDPLAQGVRQMNQTMRVFNRDISFKVVDEDGDYYVEVFDKGTDKVIRRLPPEDLLRKLERIKNDLGYIIDEEG